MKLRLRNVRIKVVALALALITWFAVRGKTIEQSDWLECPVSLLLPDDVIVQEEKALSIEIRVSGPVEKLADFRPVPTTLRIDARETVEDALVGRPSATVSIEIARPHFRLPRRIEIATFEPKTISFQVERLEETVLPVEVTPFGAPANGYRIVAARAMPSTVTLTLGAEEAKRIAAVATTPVDVTGRTSTVEDKAYLIDPRGKGTAQLGDIVDVIVTIEPVLEQKLLSPVPIMVLQRPGARRRVTVDPDAVTVEVKGRADLIASLGPEGVAAYLVFDEALDPGVYTLPLVVVSKKPSIEIVKAPTVQVTVE